MGHTKASLALNAAGAPPPDKLHLHIHIVLPPDDTPEAGLAFFWFSGTAQQKGTDELAIVPLGVFNDDITPWAKKQWPKKGEWKQDNREHCERLWGHVKGLVDANRAGVSLVQKATDLKFALDRVQTIGGWEQWLSG